MSKFFGAIGYATSEETFPNSGVWEDSIVEVNYYGDLTRLQSSYNKADKVNDNLQFNHLLSIIADDDIISEFYKIKYAVVNGVRWSVNTIDVDRPRLNLTFSGIYNGPIAESI